jgi:hypothetical protein
VFALDRLAKMAPQYPEWKQKAPFKSALTRNSVAISKFTETDWIQIIAVTRAGNPSAGSRSRFIASLYSDWVSKTGGLSRHLGAQSLEDDRNQIDLFLTAPPIFASRWLF